MAYTCNKCEKYKHRKLCVECGHRCCKDAGDHSRSKKKFHKKNRDYDSSSSSSSSSDEDSYSSDDDCKCGKYHKHGKCSKGDCHKKECKDNCRVFKRVKKKKKLKFVKVKKCKSRSSKKQLDQSFTVNDITVTNKKGELIEADKEPLVLCGKKSVIAAIEDKPRKVPIDCPPKKGHHHYEPKKKIYRNYSVNKCGSKTKCADVSLNLSTGFLCPEDCGDVKYELVVTAIRRDCHKESNDEYCEGGQKVFVKSACKPDKSNPYRLTWKNVPVGKDRTVFTFCRRELDCEEKRCGGEYPAPMFIESICVYSGPKKY